ncbi:hypothetical protein FACS1894163_04880 [Spirochaetia bacterium]|nr:hypothetical protein FACS1894163_04880 [Spirochaetia bacterium]
MTLTDLIAGTTIFLLFISGVSQAALPLLNTWNRLSFEYQNIRSISFVAESFRKECKKPARNMDKWKQDISIVRGLDSMEITEIRQGEILRALKLSCLIGGDQFESIGVCTP